MEHVDNALMVMHNCNEVLLGDPASLVEACEAAFAPLRSAPKGSTMLKEECRWYPLADCVHDEAIKPEQEQKLQVQLRV